MAPLRTAVRTLTIIPIPGRDASDLSASLIWFPVVGLLLGLSLHGLALLSGVLVPGGWPEGTAFLVMATGIGLTGALHVDGLADWADGFFGAADRERALEIMKDSSLGTFGTVAILLTSMAKWIALTRLVTFGATATTWIVVAYILSRTVQADLAARLPYARKEGGTAAPFVGHSTASIRFSALLLGLALTMAICGPLGAAVWASAVIFSYGYGAWCQRRLGGVTGDVLGAASELSETAVLLLAAAGVAHLSELTSWSLVLGSGGR